MSAKTRFSTLVAADVGDGEVRFRLLGIAHVHAASAIL